MNKEIIYIDQNDDITDVIAKIKESSEKLIVLIPPKDAEIMHSLVNVKLIDKTIKESDKKLVFVTEDAALVKFASSLGIPVSPDLKTRPSVPAEDDETPEKDDTDEPAEDTPEEDSSDSQQDTSKEQKDSSQENKKKGILGKIPNFEKNKKWYIIGGAGAFVLILFIIWATVIAPSVHVDIEIKTASSSFSENVSFVKNASEEDAASGKFYLTEEKYEKESTVDFEATGERDEGERATGSVVVSTYLAPDKNISIPSGSTMSHGDLIFVTREDANIAYDSSKCENSGDADAMMRYGCKMSATIEVIANAAGTKHNIGSSTSGWTASIGGVNVESASNMSGGSSKIVKFVQQSDIDKAKSNLASTSDSTGKAKLLEQISDSVIPIDASFKSETSNATSKPALNEAVPEGTKPTLTAVTSFTIYTIDVAKVEEFITAKTNISGDRRVYSLGEPFLEHFIEISDGFTAKLKTTYMVGPNITEDTVREKIYGKKIGEAKSLLDSINGIKTSINSSVFWVNSVPNDPNRVTVNIIDTNNNSDKQ